MQSQSSESKSFEKTARAAGHNPICVWSTVNSTHPMNAEQLRVRKYICGLSYAAELDASPADN